MDKVEHYREVVRELLNEYAAYAPSSETVILEQIVDVTNDHYELIRVGWNDLQRIHGTVIHIDIKHQKIWLQHDGTEIDVAQRLVSAGVPKEDIVLAFQAPYKRKFTEFAVE